LNQLPLALRLRERAVFDNFVAGPNSAALEQLLAVGRGTCSGVFWLAGPAGAGKSHLLQASCAAATGVGADASYLSLSQLRQFGAESLDGWQASRVVALDDIAVVIGDRSWEQALFRVHREVEERHAVLLTAAVAPPLLQHFCLADLASRFAAANLLTLRPLDESSQREALRLRALARGLELPEEAALYLQRRFPRDLSTLYVLLDAIDEAAFRAQRRLTIPFIREVLSPYLPDEPA
jgi:DnaA family protein